MKYSDLHHKTIYDFTDNPEIIEDITAGMSKTEYLANIKEYPENNGFDLEELAERTGDKDLAKAVAAQYKADFANYFNE